VSVRGAASDRVERPKRRLTDKPGAAEYLGTTVRHIDRLVYERRIPFVKVGGLIRFDIGDLDKYIKANRTEAAS